MAIIWELEWWRVPYTDLKWPLINESGSLFLNCLYKQYYSCWRHAVLLEFWNIGTCQAVVLICPVPSKNLGPSLQGASGADSIPHVLQQPIAKGTECVLCDSSAAGPFEACIWFPLHFVLFSFIFASFVLYPFHCNKSELWGQVCILTHIIPRSKSPRLGLVFRLLYSLRENIFILFYFLRSLPSTT